MTDKKREEILSKAKPILFNTEMVRAILEGRKTVTRRSVKLTNRIPRNAAFGYTAFTPGGYISVRGDFTDEKGEERYGENFIKMPYLPGNILYVRETWQDLGSHYAYKADEGRVQKGHGHDALLVRSWCPSIHMPKEAARIFLRVTNVRVERLQEIITGDYRTPININKEGLISSCCFCTHHNGDCKDYISQHSPKTLTCKLLEDFTLLWNSTIKKSDLEKYGWNADPWVWVVEFERID